MSPSPLPLWNPSFLPQEGGSTVQSKYPYSRHRSPIHAKTVSEPLDPREITGVEFLDV